MIEIINLAEFDISPKLVRILNRSLDFDKEVVDLVAKIIDDVRNGGDEAVCRYIESFEGIEIKPQNLRVEVELIDQLASQVDKETLSALRQAIANVRAFHEYQIEHSWEFTDDDEVTLGQRILPLESVGLYVPGGKAAYPSSLIMNAVPAQVAGVGRIVVVTPAKRFMSSPALAAALKELGLKEVYTLSGAQAIAALAYGTETVPRVDKIVGPGSIYVTIAKKLVFGAVGIDSLAGPTEVVVVADETADARLTAADMLSQAEHDEDASAVCITTSRAFAEQLRAEIAKQIETLSRQEIVKKSLDNWGAIIIIERIEDAPALVNKIAPEHLELLLGNAADALLEEIKNVGAIFVGKYSPEAVGDYFAGPNHVLPTTGSARFSSPLGVYDFLKRTNIIRYTEQKLRMNAEAIAALAQAEGLDAHARSVLLRLPRFYNEAKTKLLNADDLK